MLAYINKAVGLFGFRVERIEARTLRFQRGSKAMVASAVLFYAVIGWFGMSMFDISPNLGERGAGCALQFVFSPKTVIFFGIALIFIALYLLRPHLMQAESKVGKQNARFTWRILIFVAFLWAGFYQALAAVVLGIAVYVAQHEFRTSVYFFLFSVMCISVGSSLKLQGPELLWKVRRKARPTTPLGAFVSISAVLVIAILVPKIANGDLVEVMKVPQHVQCPKPSIVWG